MLGNGFFYLIELGIALIFIAIKIVKSKEKRIDKYTIGITLLILLGIIGLTYIFEIPDIEIENTVAFEVDTSERLKKPKTIYHFLNITDSVKQEGKIDYNKIGKYKISYNVNTLMGK